MTSEGAENPVFDPAAIEKLRRVAGDHGGGFITEMAQLFLDETGKSLAELRTACECGDWKAVSRLAHSVKSSAATLGLMRLSEACKALELDTKEASATPLTPALTTAVFARFEEGKPVIQDLA